jgi:enterochelin esterase-like enzyme
VTAPAYSSQHPVPGEGSALYGVDDIPHGTVSQVWYPSPSLGFSRRMYVYTPAGYEAGGERYPVFYLLHGGGGDEDAWSTMGRAPQILDHVIASGQAQPMIVVMTNGNANQRASQDYVPAPPDLFVPGLYAGERARPAQHGAARHLCLPQEPDQRRHPLRRSGLPHQGRS